MTIKELREGGFLVPNINPKMPPRNEKEKELDILRTAKFQEFILIDRINELSLLCEHRREAFNGLLKSKKKLAQENKELKEYLYRNNLWIK